MASERQPVSNSLTSGNSSFWTLTNDWQSQAAKIQPISVQTAGLKDSQSVTAPAPKWQPISKRLTTATRLLKICKSTVVSRETHLEAHPSLNTRVSESLPSSECRPPQSLHESCSGIFGGDCLTSRTLPCRQTESSPFLPVCFGIRYQVQCIVSSQICKPINSSTSVNT